MMILEPCLDVLTSLVKLALNNFIEVSVKFSSSLSLINGVSGNDAT